MKIISSDDIKSLNIPRGDCYKWVIKMIESKQHTLLPPKTHVDIDGGIFFNIMPCIIPKWTDEYGVGGVKVINRYPNRTPALDSKILLFNSNTGEFLAIMDGNWITAMRTGAVAAHSVATFSKDEWDTIGMIGVGNVARASLLMIADITKKPIYVKVYNYKGQAKGFLERFRDFTNIRFEISDSMEKCIKDSDVIISSPTFLIDDIAPDEWFDKGVLVVPVHTRGFTNCDLFFDKIFVDDINHVKHFKNYSKMKSIAEVSDVVNGKTKGRDNNEERILVYNIGIATHDINFAAHIYQNFEKNKEAFSCLKDLELHEPDEKFWV